MAAIATQRSSAATRGLFTRDTSTVLGCARIGAQRHDLLDLNREPQQAVAAPRRRIVEPGKLRAAQRTRK